MIDDPSCQTDEGWAGLPIASPAKSNLCVGGDHGARRFTTQRSDHDLRLVESNCQLRLRAFHGYGERNPIDAADPS